MRTALIRDGQVVEILEFGPASTAPDGMEAVPSDIAGLGDAWDAKTEIFKPWTPPAPSRDLLLGRLRAQRDARLASTDWTQMADAPLTDKQRSAWQAYRKALRDLPKTAKDPAAPDWPVAPV